MEANRWTAGDRALEKVTFGPLKHGTCLGIYVRFLGCFCLPTFWWILMGNVVKYTIHGCYGVDSFLIFQGVCFTEGLFLGNCNLQLTGQVNAFFWETIWLNIFSWGSRRERICTFYFITWHQPCVFSMCFYIYLYIMSFSFKIQSGRFQAFLKNASFFCPPYRQRRDLHRFVDLWLCRWLA